MPFSAQIRGGYITKRNLIRLFRAEMKSSDRISKCVHGTRNFGANFGGKFRELRFKFRVCQTFPFSNFSGAPGISGRNPGISRQKSLVPCVSRDIHVYLNTVQQMVPGELAGEGLQTGFSRHGLPPQKAPLDTVYPLREHLNSVQRRVSGGCCEGLFPDTVCWTRLRNTWDIPNFWAPTCSSGRPPPHRKISGPKSLG